jgi:hypothetical protein
MLLHTRQSAIQNTREVNRLRIPVHCTGEICHLMAVVSALETAIRNS